MFACTGILYNHESPRRGHEFVTRKIASAVAKISLGLAQKLELGNIEARRDWGYAPEYVEAMWRMLNHENPDDYVIATGKLHSVKEFLDIAFSIVDLRYENYVKINPTFFRPEEEVPLVGDCSKALSILGWKSGKTLEEIIEEMVLAEIRLLRDEK